MRRYRGGVGFVMDIAARCTTLDRNDKARLLFRCELIERRTKRPGGRNGLLGIPAMMILRTLLLRFHGKSGLCIPSYTTLQEATGLCRQSIATGIGKLEAAGVLQVTRRLVRYVDEIGAVCVRQGSNIYGFAMPPERIDLGPSSGVPRLFPRVYRIGANHKPMQALPPFERAITGAIKRAARGPVEKAVASEALKQWVLSRGM
jgi:hypothetical protein